MEIEGTRINVLNEMIRYTSFANLTGLPVLSIPCGLSSEGLPVGLQIIGKHFDEARLIQIGHLFEIAHPKPVWTGA
jgi:aspartyl-tRNA(Asn)/glutamyl-tRNA(Gln) amidotransferase subunit A